MKPYPRELLSEDEVVQFQLRPHFRALLGSAVWLVACVGLLILAAGLSGTAIIAIPLLVVAAVLFVTECIRPVLRWFTTQYVFTNRRIITREGVIARTGRDVPLAKINNVTFDVPALGRVLNYGTLTIVSAAKDDNDLVIADVPSVEMVQRQIYELYEDNDERRRGIDE